MDKGGAGIVAMNTTKLLFILVLMNILITMGFAFVQNPDSVSTNELDLQSTRFNNFGTDLNSSKTTVAPGILSVIQVAGDAVKMGLGIIELFVDGIRPFPADQVATDNDLDRIAWIMINLLRGMMYVMAGILVYDKIFNKKQD